MRAGQLPLGQLAARTRAHPEQCPEVNGEFEWILLSIPEAAD